MAAIDLSLGAAREHLDGAGGENEGLRNLSLST
jgi:hypothetical protein